MSLSQMTFDKDWTNPADFPTHETQETQVRADIQYLFNSIKSQFNRLINSEFIAGNMAFDPTAEIVQTNVQDAIEYVMSQVQQGGTATIPDGSVTTTKLHDGAVTDDKLADNAVTTSKIADNSITGAKIQEGAISGTSFQNESIPAGKLAEQSVGAANIITNCITENQLANNSVITARIKDGNVTYAKLASDTVMQGATSSANGRSGLVPQPTSANYQKYLRADGTWQNPPNTTYSAMTGATSSAAGTSGLVPAPAAGKQGQYLRGDGTWQTPTNTTYTGTAPITVSGTTISHNTSGVTTGSYGMSSNTSLNNNTTVNIPYIKVNATGHVTEISNKVLTGVNTTYTGTSPITVSGTAISHGEQANVTAGSYGLASNTSHGNGVSVNIPYITVDKKGHVTAISNKTLTGVDTNTTYVNATTASNGLMSRTDKQKLDGIASGATKTILVVDLVTDQERTVAANAFLDVKFSIAKSGYTPIGVVGWELGIDVKPSLIQLVNSSGVTTVNGTYLRYIAKNVGSQSRTIISQFQVLYKEN